MNHASQEQRKCERIITISTTAFCLVFLFVFYVWYKSSSFFITFPSTMAGIIGNLLIFKLGMDRNLRRLEAD